MRILPTALIGCGAENHEGTKTSKITKRRNSLVFFVLFVFFVVGGGGCTSPEATRGRGQGPGADVGNRPDVVLMHEGSEPFWDTPEHIPFEKPDLAPAEQASELSQS